MDITLALRRAVRGYSHGTEALAAELGMSVSSLNHKVSPTCLAAHCSPEESCEIQEITGDHGAVEAMASRLGYVLLKLPDHTDGGPAAQILAKTIAEFGHLMTEAAMGMADGVITDNELLRIEKEGADALAAIHALLKIVGKMNASGKPALAEAGGMRA